VGKVSKVFFGVSRDCVKVGVCVGMIEKLIQVFYCNDMKESRRTVT
jgi:hypothetical protein